MAPGPRRWAGSVRRSKTARVAVGGATVTPSCPWPRRPGCVGSRCAWTPSPCLLLAYLRGDALRNDIGADGAVRPKFALISRAVGARGSRAAAPVCGRVRHARPLGIRHMSGGVPMVCRPYFGLWGPADERARLRCFGMVLDEDAPVTRGGGRWRRCSAARRGGRRLLYDPTSLEYNVCHCRSSITASFLLFLGLMLKYIGT